jgi:hypothetical protein
MNEYEWQQSGGLGAQAFGAGAGVVLVLPQEGPLLPTSGGLPGVVIPPAPNPPVIGDDELKTFRPGGQESYPEGRPQYELPEEDGQGFFFGHGPTLDQLNPLDDLGELAGGAWEGFKDRFEEFKPLDPVHGDVGPDMGDLGAVAGPASGALTEPGETFGDLAGAAGDFAKETLLPAGLITIMLVMTMMGDRK